MAIAVFFAVGLEVPRWLEYAPFAVSLVFLGLPHGALDHLVPDRLAGRTATRRCVAAVVVIYLALASVYLTLWFAAPATAFALFIGITWIHWGQGDLHARMFLDDHRPSKIPARAATVFVRGGLPMLVPLLAHPETYREVLESAAGLFDPGAPTALVWAFEPSFRVAAGLVLAAVYCTLLFTSERSRTTPGARGSFASDLFEVALLAAFFVVVPPVLALGLYFCLWHAPRHIARLALLDSSSRLSLEAGRLLPVLRTFGRDAVPLTGAALMVLVGLYFVVPGVGAGAASLLGLYLVLISTLTLPHVVIVSYMDYRQGVWS